MAEAKVLDPAVKYLFEVEAGFTAGFARVGGLRDESEVIEYREGSDPPRKRKIVGMQVFPNITASRGITTGSELIGWREAVKNDCKDRRTFTVKIKDCSGQVMRTMKAERAWPVALEVDELDANTSEVSIESAEIAHEGWSHS